MKTPPTLCDNLLTKPIIICTCVSSKTIEDGLASGVQRPGVSCIVFCVGRMLGKLTRSKASEEKVFFKISAECSSKLLHYSIRYVNDRKHKVQETTHNEVPNV